MLVVISYDYCLTSSHFEEYISFGCSELVMCFTMETNVVSKSVCIQVRFYRSYCPS